MYIRDKKNQDPVNWGAQMKMLAKKKILHLDILAHLRLHVQQWNNRYRILRRAQQEELP